MMPDPLAPTPADQRIRSANFGHKPGRRIVHPDGTEYLVTETGAWERVTPRRFHLSEMEKATHWSHGVLRRRRW